MTEVKANKIIGIPMQGYFNSHIEWCRNNLDAKDVEWDLYQHGVDTFKFKRPEDALAFKIRFGL
jgi:hypothetical protein